MLITLDRQSVTQQCVDCDATFIVVRGSIYDQGEPFGLYLIALHGHSEQGRLAHVAIALRDRSPTNSLPIAVAIRVSETPEEIGFLVEDWSQSPWKNERYLGRMLGRDEASSGPHQSMIFHVAEHLINELPEVQAYFA